MGLKKLDPLLKQQAIDLLKNNVSTFVVAKKLNLQIPTVRNWYNKLKQQKQKELEERKILEDEEKKNFEKKIPFLPTGLSVKSRHL